MDYADDYVDDDSIAYLLFLPLTIFNALNVRKKGYFLDTAINIDRFGNIDETISSVLGKNQRFGHLTKFGKVICKILDTIDKNHCEKSIVW